jgi:hypothetical protein
VESKNRIRRLIQTFFKERDCFTMVRPLTDEEDLQILEKKELKDLRSEFIEQVMELRKRIFKQCKVKTLNGKQISGEMLAGLLKNYVSAINDGAVPNIENAWTYICKSHCQKLFDSCYNYYDEKFNEKLNDSFPTSQEQLHLYHSQLKQEALDKFKAESMGEATDKFVEELKFKIKDRFLMLENENKNEFEKLLVQSMKQYYSKIDDKVKNGEFKTYYEYEKELQQMKISFIDLEPQGPNKMALINDFLFSKCNDVAHFLIRNAQSDLENQLAVLK